MAERWKAVVGFEGLYEVSDLGRVRSINRIDASGHRRVGRIRKLGSNPQGYAIVALCSEGITKHFSVHRLVLNAFVGLCPEGKVAAHKNGSRAHNNLHNLLWCTQSENLLHRVEHGTAPRGRRHWTRKYPALRLYGERNGRAKLTKVDVRAIRKQKRLGKTLKQLAARFGLTYKYVSRVVNYRTWRHV